MVSFTYTFWVGLIQHINCYFYKCFLTQCLYAIYLCLTLLSAFICIIFPHLLSTLGAHTCFCIYAVLYNLLLRRSRFCGILLRRWIGVRSYSVFRPVPVEFRRHASQRFPLHISLFTLID